MAKQENIRASGVVVKSLPNAHFIVRVTDEGFEGHEVNAHISGKMRLNYIKILPGDDVILELTPFDLTKGRIVYRGKEKKPVEDKGMEGEKGPEGVEGNERGEGEGESVKSEEKAVLDQ